MSKKQKRILIRILIAAALTAGAWLAPLDGAWKAAAFAAPYLVIGYDVLWGSLRNILHGQVFDEMFLMSVATLGAFAIGEYPEAAAVMLFYQIGELFQSVAVGKSRRSIAALMDIRPDHAVVLRDGAEVTLPPDEVQLGETLLVRPGDRVPLDGEILEGRTTLNTAALTGESLPVDKSAGDKVVSGSVNLSGVIRVRVESVYAESTVARILELVESASEKKARAEKFITRFAKYYTPCVVFGALLLALLPPLAGLGEWNVWIERALIFLVISCPCALVISVPLTFFGGIGGASREGILIKGANDLETLAGVDTVVFDKTGTLTNGTFSVVAVHPEAGYTEQSLLEVAALAESFSDHPIAQSVRTAFQGELDPKRVSDSTNDAGHGVTAIIDGKRVIVGNAKMLAVAGIEAPNCEIVGTILHVLVDDTYAGHIVIADTIKTDAEQTIRDLHAAGVKRTVMLTGDREEVAASVAKQLGLDEFHAQLLPGDKVERVEALLAAESGKGKLAFVGDGINDAPVLTRADVGIAMGAMGSDAAIEAADVVLMDDKPSNISRAIRVARKTMSIVWQNIIFALGIKLLILVLAALGIANMWLAVFGDVGVAIIAILNAMRAMGVKNL